MCLIMLMMLRVVTSESMKSRPLFPSIDTPFSVTFVTCLLAAIVITELQNLVLPSISLALGGPTSLQE